MIYQTLWVDSELVSFVSKQKLNYFEICWSKKAQDPFYLVRGVNYHLYLCILKSL